MRSLREWGEYSTSSTDYDHELALPSYRTKTHFIFDVSPPGAGHWGLSHTTGREGKGRLLTSAITTSGRCLPQPNSKRQNLSQHLLQNIAIPPSPPDASEYTHTETHTRLQLLNLLSLTLQYLCGGLRLRGGEPLCSAWC